MRGVSLDEIAAATRIKTSFLEALENGRWDELPGGAFNRGFVRTTARFLGLDEDGMVAEYATETGTAAQARPAATPSGAMPRDYRPAVIAIGAALILAIGGGWFGYREYSMHKQKRAAAADSLTQAKATVSSAGGAGMGNVGAATPAGNGNDSPPPEVGDTTAEALAAARSATPETLKLKIQASKRTDVKVVGDGKILFKGRLHSDDPKSFEARDRFEVAAGDASVVQLELNDRIIPFASTAGRRGTVSIGRKDLKPPGEPSH